MRIHFLLALFLVSAKEGQSQEVIHITWPSRHAAPAVRFQGVSADFLPAFRLALETLPEPTIVAMALKQPALLGLTAEQSIRLEPLTTERYRLMQASPAYARARSALPYCFTHVKATNGLASVYVPEKIDTNLQAIVFLHGYGGSFLWYQHYLSENFPKRIIICPAYGLSSGTIPQAYVAECVDAVSKRLHAPIKTPILIGLSAGGFGACRLQVAAPRFYSRMICLAAYPTDDVLSRFSRETTAYFLSGAAEPFVRSGDLHRRVTRIQRNSPTVQLVTIPAADHFFMLAHEKETVGHLREWIDSPGVLGK